LRSTFPTHPNFIDRLVSQRTIGVTLPQVQQVSPWASEVDDLITARQVIVAALHEFNHSLTPDQCRATVDKWTSASDAAQDAYDRVEAKIVELCRR